MDDLPQMPGIRQRTLSDINGLSVSVLEAGYETPGRPAVLLLLGFPELACSVAAVVGHDFGSMIASYCASFGLTCFALS